MNISIDKEDLDDLSDETIDDMLDETDRVRTLLQEFPGEQYNLVERVKDLIGKATGERPV